jgi:hypothetical protein
MLLCMTENQGQKYKLNSCARFCCWFKLQITILFVINLTRKLLKINKHYLSLTSLLWCHNFLKCLLWPQFLITLQNILYNFRYYEPMTFSMMTLNIATLGVTIKNQVVQYEWHSVYLHSVASVIMLRIAVLTIIFCCSLCFCVILSAIKLNIMTLNVMGSLHKKLYKTYRNVI